ncbi:MAG TPA: LptE family protein [Bacteroidales bacterium]|nr:LptE family protein [Bacteroidales bacterium]
MLSGCTISYKLNGASIDYSRVKSISIQEFPNQASYVYPPFAQSFTEGLKEKFITQTKLKMKPKEGDLQLEGEIVGWDLTPMAQQADGYASETKLTITVNVRFTNTTDEKENFEQKFTAFRQFSATSMLEDVQDVLLQEITKEISEAIFNKTVANW